MNDRLSADELAEMIDCKPNQRMLMCRWLSARKWMYEADRNGLPIVMRSYRDRKLGIEEGMVSPKYDDEPNFNAFTDRPAKRKRTNKAGSTPKEP